MTDTTRPSGVIAEAGDATSPLGPSIILYGAVHIAAVAAPFVAFDAQMLAILAGTYLLRMFGITAGYHRFFAHRAFKTSRVGHTVLALLGMLAMQRGAIWWAETHRSHHRHTDTPEDIHAPKFKGFWYSHMGWFFDPIHRKTRFDRIGDLTRYPELMLLNGAVANVVVITLYGAGLVWLFDWSGFLWGFCVSTVFLWHTVHWIQSMSHTYGGYRNFDSPDDSRNHWLLGVVSLGEYHNNHHHRASSARQGYRWFEIDVTWWILRGLEKLRLVWDVRDRLHQGPPIRERTS